MYGFCDFLDRLFIRPVFTFNTRITELDPIRLLLVWKQQHVCFRYMQNLVSFYFWSVLVTEFCQVTSNLSKNWIESKRNNVSYVSNINNHMVYGGVCFHWNFLFWPVLNRFAWFSLLILSSSIRVVYFDHYFNSSRPTHYKNGQIALPYV